MNRSVPREIRTGRDDLVLAPLTAAHVGAGYALLDASRARIEPWMAWARGSTRDAYAEFVHACERRAFSGNPLGAYALLVGGEFAGQIDAHDHNAADRLASIGYWLGTPFSGHGYMTNAVAALTLDIFARAVVERLEIYVASGNERSLRVAERAGYRREATLKSRLLIGDRRADAVLFARVRSEAPVTP